MQWDVEGRKCCSECFQHPWLREHIQEDSRETGTCRYCGGKGTTLVEVANLSGYFENVLTMYTQSNSERGDPLVYLLQDDWSIFSDELFDSGGAARLLEDIMLASWDDDSGESPADAHELYVRVHPLDYVGRFEVFLDEARESPDAEPDSPEILREDIWRYEATVQAGTILCRARLGWQSIRDGEKVPWSGAQIGANEDGPPGRANREDEVVLYCADHEKTAIAEVRPARGFVVSVCELRASRDLRILDLCRPRESLNPFLESDGLLASWLELDELLNRMAWALAKPLERDDNPLDYVPSQKLSAFAKQVGFDGIRYPSAMDSGGSNLAIYDPQTCNIGNSKLVKVTAVNVDYTGDTWHFSDDFPEL